ncbi:MAG TPA: GNAT family N-acetyltransferase [Actinomycetota bacterium]
MAFEPIAVGEVVIEEIDLKALPEEDVLRLNQYGNLFRAERNPEDPPRPVELTRASLENIPPFIFVREFWARDPDGSIAASAEVSYLKADENKHLVEAGINVRADRRRRGIAKALLRIVADVTREERRTLIMSGTSERIPAGDAFARAVGADPGLANHVNRLLLSDLDADLMRRWIKEGPERAAGYRLDPLDGPYPDERIEAIVDMHAVMNTAPRDDLDMEDWNFTVEHARDWEKSMKASGDERWSLFAIEDATGTIAGFTEVLWNPKMPKIVHQLGTGVRPEHRGRALGKWLKAAMIERVLAERPDADQIRTGNADSNDAMLSINDQLGFKRFEASMVWQVPLEKVDAYLASIA